MPDVPDPHADALAQAIAEERYLRQKVDLYRAKSYSGRPTTAQRLRELERAHAGAQANLERIRRTIAAQAPEG